MAKVLIYHNFTKDNIDYLEGKFLDCQFIVSTDKGQMEKHIIDTDILIGFDLDNDMLAKGTKIKWVQALSAGVENFPLRAIKDRGIILTNGKGIHKIHMAEYAICIMIILARNIHVLMKNKFKAKWDKSVPQGEIYGATVGILGLGSIGMEVAKKAKLMGMKVIGVKKMVEDVEFVDKVFSTKEISEVFRESDYIISLLPSVKNTFKVINKKYFDLMKKDSCFINMGRGSTVNEDDVIDALLSGKFRAFASDVFFMEPLPKDSPLWQMDNVIITPHICGESSKYIERALDIIENNINAYKGNGNYMNLVNLDKGY